MDAGSASDLQYIIKVWAEQNFAFIGWLPISRTVWKVPLVGQDLMIALINNFYVFIGWGTRCTGRCNHWTGIYVNMTEVK